MAESILTLQLLDFPDALRAVTNGERVTRAEWADETIYLYLWNGFLSIHRPDKTDALLVSAADMQADDWIIL